MCRIKYITLMEDLQELFQKNCQKDGRPLFSDEGLQILSGTLPQGELLPGVRTLAADLSVSIITTRRAYEELERDGYIKTLPGRGSIVSIENREHLLELHRQEMRGWLERAVSAAKAAGVSREEIIEQISRLYDQAGEEK